MLINEVNPINEAAINLLQDGDNDIIDEIIEIPLRKACKVFKQKGIETVMSSANKSNVLEPGEKIIEKEDVYGTIEKLFENHSFLEAGKGYAWIMLNFNTLSDENKDLLFELEKRHIVLLYPWTDSSTEAVFLRMPINAQTTVEEVEQYFVNFAECFKNQIYDKKLNTNKR